MMELSLGLRGGREACWAVRAGVQVIRIQVVTEKRGGEHFWDSPSASDELMGHQSRQGSPLVAGSSAGSGEGS